jgi:hypothetical protein
MIYFLEEICTIFKPMIQENGLIELEDFGDYFCKIERRDVKERYSSKYITHKAKMAINGVKPGDRLITTQHNYFVVSVNSSTETLGLLIQK